METELSIKVRMQKEPKLVCPRCTIQMEKLTNGKYIIDKCRKCGGVWLDKGEITNIKNQGFIHYVKNYWRKDK